MAASEAWREGEEEEAETEGGKEEGMSVWWSIEWLPKSVGSQQRGRRAGFPLAPLRFPQFHTVLALPPRLAFLALSPLPLPRFNFVPARQYLMDFSALFYFHPPPRHLATLSEILVQRRPLPTFEKKKWSQNKGMEKKRRLVMRADPDSGRPGWRACTVRAEGTWWARGRPTPPRYARDFGGGGAPFERLGRVRTLAPRPAPRRLHGLPIPNLGLHGRVVGMCLRRVSFIFLPFFFEINNSFFLTGSFLLN